MPLLTTGEALACAAAALRANGAESPRLDAEVILAYVMKISRPDLYVRNTDNVPDQMFQEYLALVQRRIDGEPVAYITLEKEFMSLKFAVDRSVLIPRPETETLVEEALKLKPRLIVDVGTGSGAIAVSLAYYLPDSRVAAIDVSMGALRTAKMNAAHHGVADRIAFFQGNLLEPLDRNKLYGRFNLITANLPYIPTSEMDKLPVTIRKYEPAAALDGGADGLRFYREMGPTAVNLLSRGGVLLIETGYQQAAVLQANLEHLGLKGIQILKDLAGFERVIKAVKE